jgi:DNA modification methylase
LFFVRFLTDAGDLVLDPFAGSNTTGEVCEAEGRRWVAVECDRDYLETSRFRFELREAVNGAAGRQQPAPKKRGGRKQVSPDGNGQRELFSEG